MREGVVAVEERREGERGKGGKGRQGLWTRSLANVVHGGRGWLQAPIAHCTSLGS